MSKLGLKLLMVLHKSPVSFSGMVLAEPLPFLSLLLGSDYHGQIEGRVNFKVVYIGTDTYYLEYSI